MAKQETKLEHLKVLMSKISDSMDHYILSQNATKLPLRKTVLKTTNLPLVYVDKTLFSSSICNDKKKISLVIKVAQLAAKWNEAVYNSPNKLDDDYELKHAKINKIHGDWQNISNRLINNSDILHKLYTIEI